MRFPAAARLLVKVAAHAALTDIGKRRRNNEDSVFASPDRGLYVVADGMGGHAAGEVASRLTVESIDAFFRDIDDHHLPEEAGQGELLREAILHANQLVIEATKEKRSYRGMASTVVAALLDGQCATVAHAGDSRAYLLRAGVLTRLTRDHSWVAEQMEKGVLTAEQARTHALRSMVTRAVGGRGELDVEMTTLPLRGGDRLLLCSDGLTSMVAEEDIARILTAAGDDVQQAAQGLVDEANARGGDDNVTALLVRLEEA